MARLLHFDSLRGPDLLQDLRKAGVAIDDFAPLLRRAEDYVQMWEKCAHREHQLT